MMIKEGTLKLGVYEFKIYKEEGKEKRYIRLVDYTRTLGYSETYRHYLAKTLSPKEVIHNRFINEEGKNVRSKFVTLNGFYELVSVCKIDIAHDIRCELFKCLNFDIKLDKDDKREELKRIFGETKKIAKEFLKVIEV